MKVLSLGKEGPVSWQAGGPPQAKTIQLRYHTTYLDSKELNPTHCTFSSEIQYGIQHSQSLIHKYAT